MTEAADPPGSIPTGSHSCEASTSSAARSPTRRRFPPGRLAAAAAMTIAEILRRAIKEAASEPILASSRNTGAAPTRQTSGPDGPPPQSGNSNPAPAYGFTYLSGIGIFSRSSSTSVLGLIPDQGASRTTFSIVDMDMGVA